MDRAYIDKQLKAVEAERNNLLKKADELTKQACCEHEDHEKAMNLIDEAIVNTQMASALITLENKFRIQKLKCDVKKNCKLLFERIKNVF